MGIKAPYPPSPYPPKGPYDSRVHYDGFGVWCSGLGFEARGGVLHVAGLGRLFTG